MHARFQRIKALCKVKPAALQNITAKIGTFGQITQIIFHKFSRDLNGLTGAVRGGKRQCRPLTFQ